jgi:hypothetical protein
MAINEKVGILTHVPGEVLPQPGLIDNIYAKILTKELDFLDDVNSRPLASDFTADPTVYTNVNSWEDLGMVYRAWRDAYFKEQNEYWLSRTWKDELVFRNWVQDPVPGGGNPYEFLRFTVPSREGEFNLPYPNPAGSEHYSFQNSRRALYEDYTLYRMPDIQSMFDQYLQDEERGISQIISYTDSLFEEVYDENGELTGYTSGVYDIEIGDLFTTYRARRDEMYWLLSNKRFSPLTSQQEIRLNALKSWYTNFDKQAYLEMSSIYGKTEEEINTPVLDSSGNSFDKWYPGTRSLYSSLEGATSFNILPPFQNIQSARLVTGNVGDVARILDDGGQGIDYLVWDQVSNSWENMSTNVAMSDYDTTVRARRDARLKAKNEVILAMRPFLFAGLDIPSFQLTTDSTLEGELRSFPSSVQ